MKIKLLIASGVFLFIYFCYVLAQEEFGPNIEDGWDLRWACVLYDSSQKRCAAVYVERFGHEGYFGQTGIRLNGNLRKWLLGLDYKKM